MLNIFIKRPVMAIILSLGIVFTGILSIKSLPVNQYPEIAPPRITLFMAFPGSNADTLVKSTLITIERSINGVPGMKFMISDATSAGEATIQVIFELGVDPNVAMMNVKSRLDKVMSRLPRLVQLEGIIVDRVQPSMLMYVNLYSTDEAADEKFLYNYANVHVIPEIQRINGIAQAKILGSRQYAMRIWLNPDRMRAYNVSTEEVMEAIDSQSIIATPGRLGQASGLAAQSKEYTLIWAGQYNKPEQYENIIIRADENGEILRLKDIGKVELSSEFFDIYSNKDGYPSAAIVLKQNYGTNAREVIKNVKAKLEELAEYFPPGMDYEITYDVSTFLDASIEKVIKTLVEAFILVSLVVFIFLGDWRSTLVPILAIPVSLIGAFLCMKLFGLSINMITLFAMILAIGIVVDDAIVVVEAVHAKFEQDPHTTPYQAAQIVLKQIGGAIVAITLVMTSVFVPLVFMTGPVGVFYQNFAITMASAIAISGFVALTLTPVLCAIILRNEHGKGQPDNFLGRAIARFNVFFDRLTGRFVAVQRRIVTRKSFVLGAFATFVAAIVAIDQVLPKGFVPSEDQGMIYAIVQTPPGSTLEMTNKVVHKLQEMALGLDEVQSVSALAGYEVMTEGRGSNAGTCIINLKPWGERDHDVREVMEKLEHMAHAEIKEAIIEFFEPPAVPGYGTASGLAFRLLDKTTGTDYHEFDRINKEFMAALRERPELKGLFTFYAANYPQLEIEIDNELAMQKGVTIKDALDNLSILVGSTFEQTFVRFNNTYRVYTQAAPEFRRYPSDILNYYVKNEEGEMVPYSSFMRLIKRQGPNEIMRYNLYNSAVIRANPAPGYTSDDGIKAIKEVAAEVLPPGFDVGWEGLTFDEERRGNEALYIFLIVLVFVYMVLAAQYESFVLPFVVLMSLPVGIFGAYLMLKLMGLANDIYAQIGLIMLVGLLGKNAILIVEYAVQMQSAGKTILEAAIESAKVRFRPIMMTSFAFIAGLIPLVLATGPGAVSSRTIGASALGGMLAGTLIGIFLIPGLYYLFANLIEGKDLIKNEEHEPLTEKYDYNIFDENEG